LEEYFEDPNVFMNREPCQTKCSYCCGEQLLATNNFCHASLVSFLSTKVFLLRPVPVAQLIKCLGINKSKVFTMPAYKLNQGIVHALVLQLIAGSIISIFVGDESEEGTSRLSITNFVVNWAIINSTTDSDSFLAHTDDSLWSGFNYI
jgi:hypothetical protein